MTTDAKMNLEIDARIGRELVALLRAFVGTSSAANEFETDPVEWLKQLIAAVKGEYDAGVGPLFFGAAIAALKAGRQVTRAGWNGKNMWLELQVPDGGSKMTLPYIFMRTVTGDLVPWLASQSDVLGEDWFVVDVGVPKANPVRRAQLLETISFLGSVIKSGEGWTEECEARMAAIRERG